MTDVPQDVREKVASACLRELLRSDRSDLDCFHIADAAIAALREAGWRAVPEGYVVVPRKLTDAMALAGYESTAPAAARADNRRELIRYHTEHIYDAMLSAAPEPPA